jgi:nucleoside-diphosphate-sugar epimerase
MSRIFVAGHNGMVGAALVRALGGDVITADRHAVDLRKADSVRHFFDQEKPDVVFLAAAKVGGILANSTLPAEFIADNLAIALNVIDAAWRAGVQRLLFLGSSCIYPRLAEQPMREEALLTGALEPTNEPYAIAKIAGIKLCESYNRQYGTDFRSVMPTNLYGPGDNFDANGSHVIPALMRRFHEAKTSGANEVVVWGSGTPRREFLHVDDLARACVFVDALPKERYASVTQERCSHLNVGVGEDLSIADLAREIAHVVGFEGRIAFDPDKPDGAPRKLLDVSRLHSLGWRAQVALREGLAETYAWFKAHHADARGMAAA